MKKKDVCYTSLSPLIYESGTNTPGHSLQQFIIHEHFGNVISLSGN